MCICKKILKEVWNLYGVPENLNSFCWALNRNVARIPQDFIHSPSSTSAFVPLLSNTSDLPIYCTFPSPDSRKPLSHSAFETRRYEIEFSSFVKHRHEDMNGHVLIWSAKKFPGTTRLIKCRPAVTNPPTNSFFFSCCAFCLRSFKSSLFLKAFS